jgi:hypothetical protein
MKLRPIYAVGLLIFVGLLVIGETLYVRIVSVPPQAIATCFSQQSTTSPSLQSCLESTVQSSLVTHPTADLLAYIIASTSPAAVTQNCHQIAHVIGAATFAKAGTLPAALAECNDSCNDGCIHGAVAASVAATFGSDTLTTQVVQDHFSAIQQLGMTYCKGDLANLCHAMGHVFFIGAQNIPSALQTCDSVAASSSVSKESCYEGVFMEASSEATGSGLSLTIATSSNAMPGMDMSEADDLGDAMDPTQPMSLATGETSFAANLAASTTLNYSFPCTGLSDQYLHACFIYWTHFQDVLFAKNNVPAGEQFSISANACKVFGSETQADCFIGVGFWLSSTPGHPGISLCNTLSGEDETGCIVGIVSRYSLDDDYSNVNAMCTGMASGNEQQLCYDVFFQTLTLRQAFSNSQMTTLCSSLPDAAECHAEFAQYQRIENTLPNYNNDGL